MIYALGITVLSCFLVTICLIAYVWTLKQAGDIKSAEMDRKESEIRSINQSMLIDLKNIADRIQKLEVRPEAPAVEQYKKVLAEIEELGHTVRTIENKMIETVETVRRTQNKIAARTKREKEPDPEPEPGEGEMPPVFYPEETKVKRPFGKVR